MEENNRNVYDFILDEKFQKWVLHPEEFLNHYWHNYINAHPDRIELIQEAKSILLSIQIENQSIEKEYLENQFKKTVVRAGIINSGSEFSPGKQYLKIAAAVVFLLISSFTVYFYFFYQSYDYHCQTDFGEIKQIVLPDSTVVTLNGNSSLSYNDDWVEKGNRRVWLDGEAFFHVKHHPKKYPLFYVNAGDINIEVTGTKFNCRNRENKKSVVLNEGSLNVSSNNNQALDLIPGEMAIYNSADAELTKINVKPEIHKSWIDHRLVFSNTPLLEVIQILENTYGMQVEYEPSIKQKMISGTVPSENLDMLLLAIEKTFDLKIKKEDNHIKIY